MSFVRGVDSPSETLALVGPPGGIALQMGSLGDHSVIPVPVRGPSRARPSDPGRSRSEALSSFVGRRDEVAAVTEMVNQNRLVTICGTGGIGKTRLALEVARRRPAGSGPAAMSCGDGVWMVELAPVHDDAHVPAAVLTELIGPSHANGHAAHDVVDFLRDRPAVLVLDNCEHVIAGCVALVSSLLRSCPRLRVLATSREPLHITGERVWWLQPLTLPDWDETDTKSLAASEAVQLFVQRTRDVVPDFTLDADVALPVAEICRRLDGLPLAIELAAARSSALSPAEIVDRLDDRFSLLTRGSVGVGRDARHRTLRATLEWSHDVLPQAEAVVFRRLSVFAGGWSLAAAEEVACEDGVRVEQVLDLVTSLVARSLVVAEQRASTTRFRMLETIRLYARSKLDEAGEAYRVQERHAAWCVGRAELAEENRAGAAHETWLQRLEDDADNFRAALGWAREHDDGATGLRLANALTWFWQTRGNLREGLEWLQWALSASGDMPSAGRAKAMRSVGRIVLTLGDHSSGLAMIDRSVALFREVGEPKEAGGCVCHELFQMCRNPLHAIPAMERNLADVRSMDDTNRVAHALSSLGLAKYFRGDAAGARACFVEVTSLHAAGIDGDASEQALMGLARVALLTGHFDEAEAPLAQVLEHAQRVRDPDGQSAALCLLGDLARARGDLPAARALLSEALGLARDAGAALSIARCELFRGNAELAADALDAARTLFRRARRRVEGGAALAYHQVRCTLGLADVAAASGDTCEAASLYADAQDTAEANGDDQAVARSLAGRADLAMRAGDLESALQLRYLALDLLERIGELPAIAQSFEALGVLARRKSHPEKAARLFAAAAALRDAYGIALPDRCAASHAAEVDRVRRLLSEAAWRQAWDRGYTLPLDESLAYARKRRGQRGRPANGWDSLTPAERDVVALVTEGLTNPEVGARLFISRRTVGHHLTHVYAKLGVRSRSELTREAMGAPDALRGPERDDGTDGEAAD